MKKLIKLASIYLIIVIAIIMMSKNVYAKFECGAAVFRNLNFPWIGENIWHAGLYYQYISYDDIWNYKNINPGSKDFENANTHAIIHIIPSDNLILHPLNTFLYGFPLNGIAGPTFDNSDRDRLQYVLWDLAVNHHPIYWDAGATNIHCRVKEYPDMFRCDGLVEWVYEKFGYGSFDVDEEHNCFLQFLPSVLYFRLTRFNYHSSNPQIKIISGGKELNGTTCSDTINYKIDDNKEEIIDSGIDYISIFAEKTEQDISTGDDASGCETIFTSDKDITDYNGSLNLEEGLLYNIFSRDQAGNESVKYIKKEKCYCGECEDGECKSNCPPKNASSCQRYDCNTETNKCETGGNGTCPDENVIIGGGQPTQNAASMAKAPIGILSVGFARGALNLLSSFGVNARLVEPENFSPALYAEIPLLIIPSGGLSSLSNSTMFKNGLWEYVEKGGNLLTFTQDLGNQFSILPGGEMSGYGWDQDINCQMASAYMEEYHQVLSGLDAISPNISTDGYFVNIPDDAHVLLRRSLNGMPNLIYYPYGQGLVFASTAYSDFAFGSGQYTQDDIILVRDLVNWLRKPSELIEFSPGDEISYTVPIHNFTNNTVKQIRIEVFDPFRKNIYYTFDTDVTLAADQSIDLPVSWQSEFDAPLGIWHTKYTFLEIEDRIQLPSEIMPYGWSTSGRFVITNPDHPGYVMQGVTATVTTSAKYYLDGAPVQGEVHIWNRDNMDREVTFHVSSPHIATRFDCASSEHFGVIGGKNYGVFCWPRLA